MSYAFSLDDVAFLRSREGGAALEACSGLDLTEASRLSDVAAARRVVGARYAPAVLETLLLRRRAGDKVAGGCRWLFTDEALQQASASVVAAYRARRLSGRDVHDVTCSVGADLVELARTTRRCVGSDMDPVRLAMAAHNCAVSEVRPALVRADALRPVTRDAVVVADPARRDASGRRRWRPEDFVPALDDLASVYAGRELAVKCSPGLDPQVAPWAREVEIISLDGRVREASLYSEGLATASRRATVLNSAGEAWSITDAESDDIPVGEAGQWIIDPDGAVVRAGLVRHYAARHGLWQLDPRIAYLTGDTPPPGVRAFRVLESGRYSEKTLRAALRRHDVGRLEILVRGLDVDPDALRRRLKPRGTNEASVVLTRIGRTPTAFVCRAERTPAERDGESG